MSAPADNYRRWYKPQYRITTDTREKMKMTTNNATAFHTGDAVHFDGLTGVLSDDLGNGWHYVEIVNPTTGKPDALQAHESELRHVVQALPVAQRLSAPEMALAVLVSLAFVAVLALGVSVTHSHGLSVHGSVVPTALSTPLSALPTGSAGESDPNYRDDGYGTGYDSCNFNDDRGAWEYVGTDDLCRGTGEDPSTPDTGVYAGSDNVPDTGANLSHRRTAVIEDSPEFDCRIDGNQICGPGNDQHVPAGYYGR